MLIGLVLMLILVCWTEVGNARPTEDLVVDLPGVNFQMSYEQYSGYLNAGRGNQYHYWFFTSETNETDDPLIFFFNGGPGCSSLVALFTECGPFIIRNRGQTLVQNPYSWNRIANIVFLESPAETGFSYNTSPTELSDTLSVESHYEALSSFFDKFPDMKNRSLYLTGQSYAAVYVTMLAKKILEAQSFPATLKGLAIMNGLLNRADHVNSNFYYNYYHGILPQEKFTQIMNECCSKDDPLRCNVYKYVKAGQEPCSSYVQSASAMVGRDPFNTNFDCYRKIDPSTAQYLADDEDCGVPFGNITKHYLDRANVRQAAHIPVERFSNYSFEACSATIPLKYKAENDDLSNYFKALVQSPKRPQILLVNGEYDSMISFLGTQWFINDLNLPKIGGRDPVFFTGNTQNVFGYQQLYNGLDYIVARGAGHYTPADKRAETLQIMRNFLNGQHNYSEPVDPSLLTRIGLTIGSGSSVLQSASLLLITLFFAGRLLIEIRS